VFADVCKNRRLVDRWLVGCLEVRHCIGGHAWLGSSGLHRSHPLGMVGSSDTTSALGIVFFFIEFFIAGFHLVG